MHALQIILAIVLTAMTLTDRTGNHLTFSPIHVTIHFHIGESSQSSTLIFSITLIMNINIAFLFRLGQLTINENCRQIQLSKLDEWRDFRVQKYAKLFLLQLTISVTFAGFPCEFYMISEKGYWPSNNYWNTNGSINMARIRESHHSTTAQKSWQSIESFQSFRLDKFEWSILVWWIFFTVFPILFGRFGFDFLHSNCKLISLEIY